jgi:hypothetical protein
MKSLGERNGNKRAVELVRWIVVLPAALLAVVALGMIARVLMPPALAQPPGSPAIPVSDFQRFVLPRVFGVLMAAAFVIAGALTAPRRRFATASVLAALWIFYCFNIHVLLHLGRGALHYTDFMIAVVAAACGAACIFYFEKSLRRR